MDSRLPGPGYSGELALAVDVTDVNSRGPSRDASAAWPDALRRGRDLG